MSLPEEPYTRVERYLAKLAGQDVDIPDRPITRIECYLDYLVNNGGGVPVSNAGGHNAIFRGQSLGTEFTADQSAAIQAGTFDGLFIGDYWTMGGVKYRVAGLDIFLNVGSPEVLTVHHAVIVPDTGLYNSAYIGEGATLTGYKDSLIRQGLSQALATVQAAFGDSHIITHRTRIVSAVTNGAPSNAEWVDSQIDLMNESQVLGRGSWGTYAQSGYNIGERDSQFPLFSLAPEYKNISKTSYWLQDIASAVQCSEIYRNGLSYLNGATGVAGVRPYFLIA